MHAVLNDLDLDVCALWKVRRTRPVCQGWSGLVFLALSVAGLILSLGITKVRAADPSKKFQANPLTDPWKQLGLIRRDRVLWLAILGNTYFWFLAALLTANIVFYGEDVLHSSSTRTGILQAAVAIGMGWAASRRAISRAARSSTDSFHSVRSA
jgi:hypothetical protein